MGNLVKETYYPLISASLEIMVWSVNIEVVEARTKKPLINAKVGGIGVVDYKRQSKPGAYKVFLEERGNVIISAPGHLSYETDWTEADRDETYLITLDTDILR